MGTHPETTKRVATLLKKQKGKCTHCGLYFREEDVLEIDHIIPKVQGGKDEYKNLQILHRHCHDTKTATDGSHGTKSDCNSVKPKSAPKKKVPTQNASDALNANEVWRKGMNGETMTPEEEKLWNILTY